MAANVGSVIEPGKAVGVFSDLRGKVVPDVFEIVQDAFPRRGCFLSTSAVVACPARPAGTLPSGLWQSRGSSVGEGRSKDQGPASRSRPVVS